MTRVTGIGGIFFKARDPKALGAWYESHLGVPLEEWGGTQFHWRRQDAPERTGYTVWSLFKQDSTYFDPGTKPFMVNYIVDDLDAMRAKLRAEGVVVDDRIDESEYGRFGWAMDPEGNRFELWEPPPETGR
ncbi:MAG: VOC family protein [Gemmatimonadales bacterium]